MKGQAMTVTGILKDASSTITTGGTAQSALAANPGRKYLLIQNPSTASEVLWVNLTGTAVVDTQGSVSIEAGGALVFENGFEPSNAVSVIAATTGHKFTIWWA
jgi:hypothetical protein